MNIYKKVSHDLIIRQSDRFAHGYSAFPAVTLKCCVLVKKENLNALKA